MTLDESIPQGGCLGGEVGIQVLAGKGHAWLSDGRFEGTEVAETSRAAALVEQTALEDDDLAEGEVPHLGEAAIEVAVLFEGTPRRLLEVVGGGRDEVSDRRGGQFSGRDAQLSSGFTEAALGVVRELDGQGHEDLRRKHS